MFVSADGNNTTGALSPASQSQDLAQQVRDNDGILLEMNERLTCQHIL